MSLDFIDFEDVDEMKDERILIIDGHNIAYITVFSTISKDYSDNGKFKLWKHSFFSKLFSTINNLHPTKCVLVFDTPNSWRRDVYKEYKANRKKQGGKYPLDKEAFNEAMDNVINDIKTLFTNMYVMQYPRAEGDDIIAVLSRDVFNNPNEEVIIVSTDGDLNQLTSSSNVSQYNPMKNEFVNIINPKKELDIKILSGDKSDNISPIKRGVGPKNALKILNEGFDDYISNIETELERNTIESNYARNKKLIDLQFIPNDIKLGIIDLYDSYELSPLDGKLVGKYFMKNKIHSMTRNWGKYSSALKVLS